MSISAITNGAPGLPGTFTVTNHNLDEGMWITLSGVTGTTSSDGVSLNGRNFKVVQVDVNNITLTEFTPISPGTANGLTFDYDIEYQTILPGSIQINVGPQVYTDRDLDGILYEASNLGIGTINYNTGAVHIDFNPAVVTLTVTIRLVTLDPQQGFDSPVETTGVYGGGGEIARISGYDVQTKYFNFFGTDKRARLSKIDFYVDRTANGQFTCNVLADSSNVPVNTPLSDNPQSNVVLTSSSTNQVGEGSETIYRLYADAQAQTIQLQLTLSDYQLAVNAIAQSTITLVAMMFSMRQGGRLP